MKRLLKMVTILSILLTGVLPFTCQPVLLGQGIKRTKRLESILMPQPIHTGHFSGLESAKNNVRPCVLLCYVNQNG